MSGWSDPQTIAAFIAAGAAVLYTALTVGILYATARNTTATRDILEAAYRPYVGIKSVSLKPQTLSQLVINVEIENVGTVPAQDIEVEAEFFLTEQTRSSEKTSRPMALLPTRYFDLPIVPPQDSLYFVHQSGARVRVIVRYKGATPKAYKTEELFEYGGPLDRTFSVLESRMS